MSARSYVLYKRRQGNITIERIEDDTDSVLQVILHSTAVVRHEGFYVRLNSGGYRTATTKTAINRYFDLIGVGYKVIQRAYEWYLVSPSGKEIDFHDGITIGL